MTTTPPIVEWDRLSALPVLVESCEYERRHATMAYGFERVTTVIHLCGAGVDGLGEDVSPYEAEDDTLHVLAPELQLGGEWTLGALCDRLNEIDLWPVAPRFDLARR
jgi:hypothetical protein